MKSYYLKDLLFCLVLLCPLLSWAELSAKVDRTELATNESLQLVGRFSGQAIAGEPDFSPIEKDFEILSTSRQQQYSVINGRSESFTDWKILLLPKRSGQLLIPPLNYKGNSSKAVAINVRAVNSAANSANKQPVYTETTVDKETAYVQEQIILTIRLVTSVRLQDFSLSELEVPDALIQKVDETQYQKIINGRNHLVVEIKFALFPQVVGKLEIPALRMGAFESREFSQFGSFSTRGNRILRLTEGKTIDILPKPTHIPATQWMPSSGLSMSETWSDNSNTLKVGEPITRTITLRAQGLTAAQIQPLPELQNDNFKVYPDQPKLEDQTSSQGLLGVRTETLAIVPSQTGELNLPPIKVEWWDTVNNRRQTSTLASRSFNVIAADPIENSAAAIPATDPLQLDNNLGSNSDFSGSVGIQQVSELTRWSMALNALLIAVLVSMLYLYRTPRTKATAAQTDQPLSNTGKLSQQLKLIEKQASVNNLGAMRDNILLWGTSLFPDQPPTTLEQLGLLMDSDQLMEQFALLDRHLFQPNLNAGKFDTAVIISILKRFRRPSENKKTHRGLKPLYPNN